MTENELNLWDRFGRGDEAARGELVLLYLPFVDIIAKRIARGMNWANWEDLRQDGVIGLIKAVERFDPGEGVKFKTFAKHHIRGAIFDSSELTRELAAHQQRNYRKVRQAEDELTKALQRNPTIEEVAEETGLTPEQINNAIDAVGLAFAGGIPEAEERPAASPSGGAAQSENAALIKEALSRLGEREARVVIQYYLEGRSAREIAESSGLTESNVTKIRQRAIEKLGELLGGRRKGGHNEDRTTGE